MEFYFDGEIPAEYTGEDPPPLFHVRDLVKPVLIHVMMRRSKLRWDASIKSQKIDRGFGQSKEESSCRWSF